MKRKDILLLAFMIFCTVASAQDLVILHTNDTHSQITPQVTGEGKGLVDMRGGRPISRRL